MTRELEPTNLTRFLIYPLVFLVFAVVFMLLFASASGHKLTLTGGKIVLEKTGMIILATRPSGSDIYINDKYEKRKTGFYFLPTKINSLVPGDYKITLKKEGYRNWENVLNVDPNIVTWANYALLFKENLDFEGLNIVDDLEVVTNLDEDNLSNDIIFKGKENGLASLYYYDASRDTNNKFWPPPGQLTDSWTGNFQIIGEKLNKTNNKVVLYVKNDSINEYDLIDFSKETPSIISLSLFYNKNFSNFVWDTTDAKYLFALAGTDLYRIDTESTKLGEPIATNVIDYHVDKGKIVFYVSKSEKGYSLFRMNLNGTNKAQISDTLAISKSYKISYSKNAGALAVLSNDDGKLYIYKNLDDQLSIMRLSKDSQGFKWSNDGEKILYYDSNSVKNYDFEKQEETKAVIGEKIISIDWYFDNCHYLIRTENGLFVIDYDGANKILIHSGAVIQAINYIEGKIIFNYLDGEKSSLKNFVPDF